VIEDDATFLGFGAETRRPVGRPFEVGEYIGDTYLLQRVLGRGGMSHVFEAEDARLSRRVAIKVVDDAELGATTLLLEAKALAGIRHPGLPIVHGLGSHRGWTYLVLERLYGVDLERHITNSDGTTKRLDPHEALPILASIAEVLAAVHRAGMAHRDLKPGNVMLCPLQRVVLLDFGIAIPEVDAAHFIRCGTPRYLAPEVVRGTIAPGRAHLVDAYAFGAVAFELFAGRPVFESDSTVQMLEHHLGTPAPDLASFRPDLPGQIHALVAACLTKDPGERPSDMEALAGDLRSIVRRQMRTTQPHMKVGELRETYRKVSGRKPPAPVPSDAVVEVPVEVATRIDATSIPQSWEVLIVEDDEDIREGLAAVLNARGFRTTVAANGREAHDLIERTGRRPAVILLDLMMPVMDGQGFLEHQPANPTLDGVPVLLVTAQPAERALSFPTVRGVVPKPLDTPALLRRLDDICLDSLPTLTMDPPSGCDG
jgi:serine/threonine protein kinase/CheY-like chemotaxis protein